MNRFHFIEQAFKNNINSVDFYNRSFFRGIIYMLILLILSEK